MTRRTLFTAALAALSVAGCTDAQRGKLLNLGNSAHIKCWSGNVVIYDGVSTGKVSSESNSDGYYFRDKASGKLLEVSGNCVIEYD